MRRGDGSLFYATRAGVRETDVIAAATAAPPAPSTWAHWTACAWTAAWLTSRGRKVVGSRELQLDDAWHGELQWLERDGQRRRGHSPDLAGALPSGERWLPIEVELASKSTNRLRSILALHASWIAAAKTDAVMYVCGGQHTVQRVLEHGAVMGLSVAQRTLRVETVGAIRRAAVNASSCEAPQPPKTAVVT
jgi:hypothetical protein